MVLALFIGVTICVSAIPVIAKTATIRSIDPGQRRVETDAGSFDADVMVVALRADLDPAATPGLVEGGYEFYSMPGALAVRNVLAAFDGGRVVIGVTSTPFKCPPAPSEVALLMHDYLIDRGRRDRSEISLITPLGAPIPPSPGASKALLAAFAGRDIRVYPSQLEIDSRPGGRPKIPEMTDYHRRFQRPQSYPTRVYVLEFDTTRIYRL